MPDTIDMSHMAVCNRPLSRETHIRLALNCIYHSEHLRLGPTRTGCLMEAGQHLRAAGFGQVAKRVFAEATDGNGSDIAAIERDVKAAAEGDARPA